MTAPIAEESRRRSPLTVQGWLIVVLASVGVVVLGGAVVGAVLLQRTDRLSNALIDDLHPARVETLRLQVALLDQETAVRGYALAADTDFLDFYETGRRVELAAAGEIQSLLGGYPDLLADLAAIEDAAQVWRTRSAQPLIASVTPGAPKVVDQAAVAATKRDFDAIRTLFAQQDANLTAEREASVAELHDKREWRNIVLGLMIAAFVVTAVLLGVVARWAVTRPLWTLARACRGITEGRFTERIGAEGPKDIRAIAEDVEGMRQRLVDALGESQASERELARQAAVLEAQTVELRRSNSELEQFAYVASHDLQEPLRKVASFCQLLEKRYRDQLDERGVQYIDFAVDGAKRMQVLINDLLTFSRVGRLGAASTLVDLDETIEKALQNLSIAVSESAAVIVRPSSPLPNIIGDPTLLVMVWQNLIGNAIKFRNPDTTPRIQIAYARDNDEQWLVTLSDNGIGIADEFVDKVFVIFQRLHGRDTYAGTGIGLALCRKIIEHHGGRIWIDTTYDGGTRFCFTLPVLSHREELVTALEGTNA